MSATETAYWNGEFSDSELDAIADEGELMVFAPNENDPQLNPKY